MTETMRERLLTAAEQLFGQQGVTAVSLREVLRASGARNASALQYHFGDRTGLVRALLERHAPDIESRRHALLDAYVASGRAQLRDLSAALVLPLASKLADESGRAYLQILAELLNKPHAVIDPTELDPQDSLMRWRELVDLLIDDDARRWHRRFVTLRFVCVELARRAETHPDADQQLFVSHLVDLTTALLSAKLSTQTRRIAATR